MTDGINYQEYARKMGTLTTLSSEELVDMAEKMGQSLAQTLKINQIRRFLDALRKIEQEFLRISVSGEETQKDKLRHNLSMLRPKLAYAVGREERVKPLMMVLEPAIKEAARDPDRNFEKLLRFMEGIIAYHKYYGGRDS